jgi:chromosome partitioning protein
MIVTITALKGGVGKTTTAVHLASYLQSKAPTLLVDADKNRSALVWSREDKLDFTVASQAAATAIIQKFQHIVVDTQARPEPEELKDLTSSSDLIILPTTPNHLDLDATLKAAELLTSWGANFKVLLTQVDPRTRNGRSGREFLAEHKLPLFKTDIARLVAFERAPSRGVTVQNYSDPRAQFGWQQYVSIGQEILA